MLQAWVTGVRNVFEVGEPVAEAGYGIWSMEVVGLYTIL